MRMVGVSRTGRGRRVFQAEGTALSKVPRQKGLGGDQRPEHRSRSAGDEAGEGEGTRGC